MRIDPCYRAAAERGEGRQRGMAMNSETGGEGGAQEARRAGRERVRAVLIGPLEAAGLGRRRRVSAEEHGKMLARLAERLWYMHEAELAGLRDLCIRQAGGDGRWWPEEAVVLHWAWRLRCPPPEESPYLASLMRSALGRRAQAEGWGVALYRTARRLGPPPGRYVEFRLREQAEDDRRRAARIEERLADGVADEADRHWLAAWKRDTAEAERLVASAAEAA